MEPSVEGTIEPAESSTALPAQSLPAQLPVVPPLPTQAPPSIEELSADSGYVYALCKIDVRFPTLDVEKEVAQALGRMDTNGQTDGQALYQLLSDPGNRYLRREMCFVAQVGGGIDAYILRMTDVTDLDMFVEAIRPDTGPDQLDVVVGERGPLAPPQACNGLTVPLVRVSQVYTFTIGELVESIPRPDSIAEEDDAAFRDSSRELINRVLQLADNTGSLDEHRAVNYAVTRYAAVHHLIAEQHARGFSLTGVEVRPSRLSGPRKILTVIITTTSRTTDVAEKHAFRVDVDGIHPFLVSKLAPYFDR
jgi:hypothetical protein